MHAGFFAAYCKALCPQNGDDAFQKTLLSAAVMPF